MDVLASVGDPVDGVWRGSSSSPLAHKPEETYATPNDPIPHYTHTPELANALANAASQSITSFSLRQLFQYGVHRTPQNLLSAAQFLHKELPVRFAQRVKYLDDLPFGINNDPVVLTVRDSYIRAFIDLTSLPRPTDSASELKFTEVIRHILQRNAHLNAARLSYAVCAGAGALLRMRRGPNERFLLQEYMDRFHVARLEARLIMAQHVALHDDFPGFVGLFEVKCVVAMVVREAAAEATVAMRERYGPDVQIPTVEIKGAETVSLRYLRPYLHYVLLELIKNAMDAEIKHYRRKRPAHPHVSAGVSAAAASGHPDSQVKLWGESGLGGAAVAPATTTTSTSKTTAPPAPIPPTTTVTSGGHETTTSASSSASHHHSSGGVLSVSHGVTDENAMKVIVVLADGDQDVVIKVSDRGGGLPRAHIDLLWSYNYGPSLARAIDEQTARQEGLPPPPPPTAAQLQAEAQGEPRTGFGLPISRLIARYLGGDLLFFSMHGHGSDVYLYLRKLESLKEPDPRVLGSVRQVPRENN